MSGTQAFCTRCGHSIRDTRFCTACGAPVGSGDLDRTAARPPPPDPEAIGPEIDHPAAPRRTAGSAPAAEPSTALTQGRLRRDRPGAPGRRIVWPVAALLVVGAVVAGIVLGVHGASTGANAAGRRASTTASGGAGGGSPTSGPPATTAPATTDDSTTASSGTTSVPPTTAPNRDAEALVTINDTVAADRPAVEALLDQWVPQISSKAVGVSDPRDLWWPSVPYTNTLILQAYQRWRARYPTALLLDSSSYSNYLPGYWVVIIGQGFPTAGSVISWCQQQALTDDDCDATRPSHDLTPGPNAYQSW
jgi:hypothetical protein